MNYVIDLILRKQYHAIITNVYQKRKKESSITLLKEKVLATYIWCGIHGEPNHHTVSIIIPHLHAY